MVKLSRRSFLAASACGLTAVSAGLSPRQARAEGLTPVRLTLSWFAQAPVGGFFQALAKGFYRDAGLDVTIANGGPQVNAVQILLAGECDFITGYDFQILHGIAGGMPLVTVAASFQHDQQGIIMHAPAASLADLKTRRLLIASSSRQTFWPWLQKRYGLNDGQVSPYTFNLQPFFVSPDIAFQGYASSEMYDVVQKKIPARFFRLADEGYPPYGTTMVTTRSMTEKNPETAAAFVRASLLGWRDYLHGDPSPGNEFIRKASPQETLARMTYGLEALKAAKVLGSDDPGFRYIGTMTQDRWRATHEFMVSNGLIDAGAPWQDAFTSRFADAAQVTPL